MEPWGNALAFRLSVICYREGRRISNRELRIAIYSLNEKP
jgi:hypothetical protein